MNGVDSSQVPRLLVSVRNCEEAEAALAGGCDILDVKEPTRGPLGMASRSVIASIAEVAACNGVSCSTACGEAVDSSAASQGFLVDDGESDVTVASVEFFKLGPANLSRESDWRRRWFSAWRRAALAFGDPENGSTASGPHAVAVAYADWKRASAPSPDEILDTVAACQTAQSATETAGLQFAGILIDTFDKSSGGLLDCLSLAELEEFAARARLLTMRHTAERLQNSEATYLDGGSRLFLALAGKLSSSDLGHLVSVRPDVIAVRSAACRNQDRQSAVDAEATRQFRAEMQICFGDASVEASSLLSTEPGR